MLLKETVLHVWVPAEGWGVLKSLALGLALP